MERSRCRIVGHALPPSFPQCDPPLRRGLGRPAPGLGIVRLGWSSLAQCGTRCSSHTLTLPSSAASLLIVSLTPPSSKCLFTLLPSMSTYISACSTLTAARSPPHKPTSSRSSSGVRFSSMSPSPRRLSRRANSAFSRPSAVACGKGVGWG